MKFFALSAIAALAVCVTASPAGHMDLAKRAIVSTRTVVADGHTRVEVIDAIEATVDSTTTVTKTNVVTKTDETFIISATGDSDHIIKAIQKFASGIIHAGGNGKHGYIANAVEAVDEIMDRVADVAVEEASQSVAEASVDLASGIMSVASVAMASGVVENVLDLAPEAVSAL